MAKQRLALRLRLGLAGDVERNANAAGLEDEKLVVLVDLVRNVFVDRPVQDHGHEVIVSADEVFSRDCEWRRRRRVSDDFQDVDVGAKEMVLRADRDESADVADVAGFDFVRYGVDKGCEHVPGVIPEEKRVGVDDRRVEFEWRRGPLVNGRHDGVRGPQDFFRLQKRGRDSGQNKSQGTNHFHVYSIAQGKLALIPFK